VKGRKEVVTFKSRELPPESEPAPLPVPLEVAKAESSSSETSGSGQRAVSYALGGAGIVSLGIGTYFGFHANATYDKANYVANKSAHADADVATGAFVVGGALLAGGIVLFLTAPKNAAVAVQPSLGPSSAGIRFGANW
jgi:serine/threonine-protein kinase